MVLDNVAVTASLLCLVILDNVFIPVKFLLPHLILD
jgi:hypothetical protein